MSSFRVRKSDDHNSDVDDSDDDDEPIARRSRIDTDSPESSHTRHSTRRSVWSDVALEQSLSAQLSDGALNTARCRRGAESYDLPQFDGPPPDKQKSQPVVCVSAASDDPFANSFEPIVEEIGVKRSHGGESLPSISEQFSHRGKPFHRGRGGMPRGGGGRGRGQRGGGQKRKWEPRSTGSTKAATIANGYSLEALMAAEFPEGIAIRDLGEKIAAALGEVKSEMIVKAVEAMGEESALRLFNETREVEASGGLMVNDGSRRRTPGGVFLVLLRTDTTVSQEIKDKVFVDTGERVKKHAAHRHQRVVEKTVKQTEALVLLPQASDVLLESFKHEDAMGDEEEEEEESMQPPTRPNSQS